jgi:hypothetical protein
MPNAQRWIVTILGASLLSSGCEPLHEAVVSLPIPTQQQGSHAEAALSLSRGAYLVTVQRRGPAVEQSVGRLRYQLEIPEQGVRLDGEVELSFHLGIAEIRGESFELARPGQGRLTVSVLRPGKTSCEVRIIKNPFP